MSLPVLPPTLLNAFRAPEAAPLTIFPADDVTLDRPSEASETVPDAVSFALVAASELVEACLRLFLRRKSRECRRTAREDNAEGIFGDAPVGARKGEVGEVGSGQPGPK